MRSIEDRSGHFAPSTRHGREYLELWFSLARLDWGSLVVIPADREGSSAEVANALARIGQQLSYGTVTAIVVSTLEYGSALALADLQQHLKRERRLVEGVQLTVNVPQESSDRLASAPVTEDSRPSVSAVDSDPSPVPVEEAAEPTAPDKPSPAGVRPMPEVEPANRNALALVPPTRLIISVPPVVTEPLAMAAASEADLRVLVIRLNRSRMAEVRRTVSLLGRERIAGCLVVR